MTSLPEEEAPFRTRSQRDDRSLDGGSPAEGVPFGKYLLMGRIGAGGMAEIFRARAIAGHPAQLLAVKCMHGDLAQESRFVEMFIREGKIAMVLEHPSIVRTLDVGCVDGRYFITMEHIGGKDLTQILRRCQETGRRIPIPHCLYIGLRLCQALDYAHNLTGPQGRPLYIVNRDVSPSNIRIAYDGEVRLLDFGIAQALLQVTSEIGVLKGKVSYMSPEQVRGLPLDRRTDIFSTGIVLHEMLSCERLFRDESDFVLMELVRRAEVKPPSIFNQRVPAALDEVVLRALSREVAGRHADAASLGGELRELLEGYQFSAVELGEFVRGLFPADFRQESEVERLCLSSTIPSEEEGGLSRAARGRGSPSRRRRRRPPRTAPPPAPSRLLWISAIGLLLAGAVILVLSLR